MDHNVITVGGVAVRDFKQIKENFGVFRMMSKHRRDKENPLFIDVACFGELSEISHQYVKKGTQVHVSGRLHLKQREHEGRKFSDYSITAQSIDFSNTFSGDFA